MILQEASLKRVRRGTESKAKRDSAGETEDG